MNAARFALPPLPQPVYSFRDIPRAQPDLKGSTIEYVTDREGFQRCMAEMLLVCKEAVRRRNGGCATNGQAAAATSTCDNSKPLSLEYLADRLDVDEPLWGYVVRHKGRLQGFISVTTFTNYEASFRWDSTNDAAFSGDDEDMQVMRATGQRKVDATGQLANKLQATVRCGNIWDEGIVWPRIAEISLLGGLGCGRTLVKLVIEDLERMKASGKVNYDYVSLQATTNSVSFYESLGFVRVGAISVRNGNRGGKHQNDKPSAPQTIQTPLQTRDILDLPDNIVMSKVKKYEVTKPGEPLNSIAKKFKVDVFDVVFLNQINYPDLVPGSRLIKGTCLRIPDETHESVRSTRNNTKTSVSNDEIRWYNAKENDTPRSIAKMFNLKCDDVVQGNKNRLKGLLSNSRLKQGTQVRISHLDAPDIDYVPYAHWSFPEDDEDYDDGEPSYMMAMPLKRHKGTAKARPVRAGLAVQISTFQATDLVMHIPSHSEEVFCVNPEIRDVERMMGQNRSMVTPPTKVKANHAPPRSGIRPGEIGSRESLFNMVVRIKPGVAETVDVDTQEFKYWYVLTFIPDLRWCHLVPMVQDGTFGAEKPRASGRPKWKLVDEDLGKELDISSSLCIPVKAKGMKRTVDADKEEWDIMGQDMPALRQSLSPTRVTSVKKGRASIQPAEHSHLLLATIPGVGANIRVSLVGVGASHLRPPDEEKVSRKRKYPQKEEGDGSTLVAILPNSEGMVRVKVTGITLEQDPAANDATEQTTRNPPKRRGKKELLRARLRQAKRARDPKKTRPKRMLSPPPLSPKNTNFSASGLQQTVMVGCS